jgi:hypothetical protein
MSKSVVMENVKLDKWGVKKNHVTVATGNWSIRGLTSKPYNRSQRGLTSQPGDDENR